MLGGAFGPISDLLRDVLEDYCQTNEDLLKLVEALIDISRYKTNVAQNLNWEILNWEKIFVGAIAESHIIAKQKCEITYNISPSLPIVCGDEIEIQRVVENLLDNAIKVSFADKQVILDIVPLGVNEVKISVRDKGQGMTPQERERVFHRLTQGRGRLSRSGPALYLCRQIVEAHRGNIGVESNLDGGSTFWFTLPVTEERSRLEGRNSFI
nr:HAMP domain-containing sensor histidine kinase [Tolypothrix bouteillei]